MSDIEQMTISMPADMASAIRAAVDGGDYASTSEVIREAVRDWRTRHALKLDEMKALKADIDRGLADIAAGRVKAFDADRIIAQGKRISAARTR